MKIIISKGWSLSGPDVLEQRSTDSDSFDAATMAYADELFAQYDDAKMAHAIHANGAHWYKTRFSLGLTFERNGKTFSAGWTYNMNDGDN